MDHFAALQAFVRTVDLGSFSKAAAEQGIKVSTVSRYVSALEADLGAALLNRSTHGLHLTEIGAAFHPRALRILADLDEARSSARSFNTRPQGRLRLSAPGAFARWHILHQLPTFLAAYPDIRIDLALTDAAADLIETGVDLAIRIGVLPDSSLIARLLAPERWFPVASPAWLAANPPVGRPEDLAGLDGLCSAAHAVELWSCRPADLPGEPPLSVPMTGRFASGDKEARLAGAIDGLGVALLPNWLTAPAIQDGRLVRLLDAWRWGNDRAAVWAVYPPKKIVAPKVRCFLDFIAARIGAPPFWDRVS